MHPLDTQRNINWIVHLLGKVMIATWLGAVASLLVSSAIDGIDPVRIFVGWWPLVVGLWLSFSNAPFPKYLSDEDVALAADSEH